MSKSSQKKSAITAITNAKTFNLNSKSLNTQNIAIKNGKVIASGYIPDDENMTEINAKDHIIINNILNLFTEVFTSHKGTSNQQLQHITPKLNQDLLLDIQTNAFNYTTTHIIAAQSLSECMFIIQEQHKLPLSCHFHIIITTCTQETLEWINQQSIPKHLSFGLLLTSAQPPLAPYLTTLIKEQKIISLSTPTSVHLIDLMYQMFEQNTPELCALLFQKYSTLYLGFKKTTILLGQPANLIVVSEKKPYTVLLNISDNNS